MAFHLPVKYAAIFAALCAFLPQAAHAASSQWEATDGARIRIVAEPPMPGANELRAILQVDLEPGWKTYWREPGAAGIPPQVAVSGDGVSAVQIHFPAPEWTDDAYGSWAGYKHPVALPLTLALDGNDTAGAIAADVFLGICRDVCVPVSAHLEFDPRDARGKMIQGLLIDAAFSALPDGNSDNLAIEGASWTADGEIEIVLHHKDSGSETPQLFLSAGSDHPFSKPVQVSSDAGTTIFRARPAFDPSKAGAFDLIATARHGIDAVEITLPIAAF